MSIAEKELLLKKDFDDVYEAGKQAEYDKFWDAYQDNGNRVIYNYAFAGVGWTDENFKPKHNISGERNVYNATFSNTNISRAIKDLGIDIKTYANINNFANNARITHFNTLDFSEVTQCNNGLSSPYLIRIERLILGNPNIFTGMFAISSNVEYIGFEGIVSSNGLNLSPCAKLQKECLVALLNILVDKTGTTGTWTVTLGETNLAKLTDEEKAIATDKGWILA